jgi:hypothetical protein
MWRYSVPQMTTLYSHVWGPDPTAPTAPIARTGITSINATDVVKLLASMRVKGGNGAEEQLTGFLNFTMFLVGDVLQNCVNLTADRMRVECVAPCDTFEARTRVFRASRLCLSWRSRGWNIVETHFRFYQSHLLTIDESHKHKHKHTHLFFDVLLTSLAYLVLLHQGPFVDFFTHFSLVYLRTKYLLTYSLC